MAPVLEDLSRLRPMLEEIKGRVANLTARETSLEQHEQDLRQREADLDQRSRALEHRQAALDSEQAALGRRRTEIDKLYQQASTIREQAGRQQQDIAERTRALQARESEIQHAALQIEVQRDELRRLREDLDAERRRSEPESQARASSATVDEFAGANEALARASGSEESPDRGAVPSAYAPTASTSRGVSARRVALLSILLGIAAAIVWYVNTQPQIRSRCLVRTAGVQPPAAHAAALLRVALSGEVLSDDADMPAREIHSRQWAAAVADGRIAVRALEGSPAVELAVHGPLARRNAAWIESWISAYAQRLKDAASDARPDPQWQTWEQTRQALEQRRAALAAQVAQIEQRRQQLPETPGWDAAKQEFDGLEEQLRTTHAALMTDRERLQTLRLQQTPRGAVTAEQVAEALARDVVYQEDQKELAAAAGQYRSELAVAIVKLIDPLRALREAGRSLASVVREQLDLHPTPAARALLERASATVEELNRVLAQFSQDWDARKQEIERLNAVGDVVKLLEQQNETARAASRVALEAQRLLDDLRSQVGELTRMPEAGTREMVIASVLRGEVNVVDERLDTLIQAAQAADTQSNVNMDAADRRLRGLRRRLHDREEAVRRELQRQADQRAAAEYQATVEELTLSVTQQERERDRLLTELVDQVDRLRTIETGSRGLALLNAELRTARQALQDLARQIDEHVACEPQPVVERIEPGPIEHEVEGQRQRTTGALIAGSVVFGATWILAGLLTMGFVRR